jgi:hypothetical protein
MRRIILWFRIDLLPLNFVRVLSGQSHLTHLLRSTSYSSRASSSILTFLSQASRNPTFARLTLFVILSFSRSAFSSIIFFLFSSLSFFILARI